MDRLATLSEQNRQIALERFHLLQPYLENQVRLRQIAQDTSIPYRTLQHWAANYHQLGLAGLARKRSAISMTDASLPATVFVETREYRRFAEFCDTSRDYRYTGLCHGVPGCLPYRNSKRIKPGNTWSKTGLPKTAPPPIHYDAAAAQTFVQREQALQPTRLLIIDEADRLKISSLEALRDLFDRQSLGLILIGMPGIEKRMSHYPQLYSRIGFVHEFKPLPAQEIRQLLENGWQPSGTQLLDKIEPEAVTNLIRLTGGNFRLLQRLLVQAERILKINQLETVTRQAVESARESLVIG